MPRGIRKDIVIDAILNGIKNAEKTHEQWSGGDSLAYTAEHLINGFIVASIMEVTGAKYLTLENSCKETIDAACPDRRGRIADAARPGGRVDLRLWWAKHLPRAVIEVKNSVWSYDAQCAPDIDRIAKLLLIGNQNTLQFGVFAFFTSADDGKIKTADEKLEGGYSTILSRARLTCGSSLRVTGAKTPRRYSESSWLGACLFHIAFKMTAII